MKILVTGAHFTPAVATIEKFKKIDGVQVVYVGRKTTLEGDNTPSVESELFPKLGVKFIPIITGRLQRNFTIYTIPSLLKIPFGLLQAVFILLSQKPDVILSFGGYVAVPLIIAGWFFSIPIIIHEQAIVAGLANKISSYFADKIAVSFENTFKSNKVVLTGNPVRKEILEKFKEVKLTRQNNKLPVILIMGGNQGSHTINLAVEKCLDKLLKTAYIYHQTGDSKYKDFERLKSLENLGDLGKRYKVMKWIGEDYPEILQRADLVVSRAGINTLTELALLGKPSLLIPIALTEQNKNAGYFQDLGMAYVLEQSKLSGETLIKNIVKMLSQLKQIKEKADNAAKIVIPDAASRLAVETLTLIKRNPDM